MKLRLTFFAQGDSLDIVKVKEYLNYHLFDLDEEYINIPTFNHKNEFCEYYDEAYEQDFYELILNNIELLSSYGATRFDLMIEVYVQQNEQCNFELLSPKFIDLLGRYCVHIPISFYVESK